MGIIEEMQVEINELKTKVVKLEGKKSMEEMVDEVSEIMLKGPIILSISPQQVRDEIVAKAKADVESLKRPGELYGKSWEYRENLDGYSSLSKGSGNAYNCEYIINKDKRTVVALLKGYNGGKVMKRGIAKANPSDCFNIHLGKAISLRRALGIKVPGEYYDVPYPIEVRVGDVVEITDAFGAKEKYSVGSVTEGMVFDANQTGQYAYLDAGDRYGLPSTSPKVIEDSRSKEEKLGEIK